MWGQLSTTCNNATEVAQWGTPSCSKPRPATDNDVRDDRSNWLVAPPTLMGSNPDRLVHVINRYNLNMRGNHLAYAATQGHYLHTVSLSYFILDVSKSECLGKHSCISSPCRITIMNSIFFRDTTWSKWSKCRWSKTNYNNIIMCQWQNERSLEPH